MANTGQQQPAPGPAQGPLILAPEREARIRELSEYRRLCHGQDGRYGQDDDLLLAALDAACATIAGLTAEREMVRQLVGADESTVDGVRDMVMEWEHYSKEMNHAGYVTMPKLKEERDEARSEAERLRAAGLALIPFLHHGSDRAYSCDSIASLPARDCACGLRGKIADLRDLAPTPAAPVTQAAGDAGEAPPLYDRLRGVCICGHIRASHEDEGCELCDCFGFTSAEPSEQAAANGDEHD